MQETLKNVLKSLEGEFNRHSVQLNLTIWSVHTLMISVKCVCLCSYRSKNHLLAIKLGIPLKPHFTFTTVLSCFASSSLCCRFAHGFKGGSVKLTLGNS